MSEPKPTAARSLIFSAVMIEALKRRQKTQTRRVLRYPASVLKKHGESWARWLAESTGVPFALEAAGWRPVQGQGRNGAEIAPTIPETLRPGTRVWVRESFSTMSLGIYPFPSAWYRADFGEYDDDPALPSNRDRHSGSCANVGRGTDCFACASERDGYFKWTSARFMPRRLSRFELEVVGVRIERLQDLTETDAVAEGVARADVVHGGSSAVFRIDGAEFESAREAFAFGWDGINGGRADWECNPLVRRIEFRVVHGAR